MRAGIIGTNWGRTHIGTLRRAGVEVCALVGLDAEATARAAASEGVAVGTDNVERLEDVDLVVIASPTPTHVRYVERFRHKLLWCEKPLLGQAATSRFSLVASSARLWVNYAFPFTETAAAFRRAVLALGSPQRVDVRVRTGLPGITSPLAAWREVAVHPLAFVWQLTAGFRSASVSTSASRVQADFDHAAGCLSASVDCDGEPGIAIEVDAVTGGARFELRGGYRPDTGWSFAPVGPEGDSAEVSTATHDVWYEANCRATAAMLAAAQGGDSDERLFAGQDALEFESALRGLPGDAKDG